ncbi:hypothetical protein HU200_049256 [Digitaria exilis]|uniref:Uncharacterized protein n=1 Tax=Digitaria exilis TaxID=1010633 RepID=A0A835AW59_9POAL|nr:hypothetical protein HU200_049256 [Digitaria exilis]
MDHVLCLRNILFCPPPGAVAPPPLRADCVDDGYEELPVSVPPRVQRGLSRGDGGDAAGQVVVAPASDGGGVGGAAWLAQFFASVYGKVAGPFRS